MRPIRLEIEGFATFRSRTVLDFDDLDLVAFVGPTGAGKSTIIDAITFALYGSVARYDNANVVAPVIHQLSNEAKVRYDFELAGRRYVAVRVVRRQGTRSRSRDATIGAGGEDRAATGATTKEARLERSIDDGETEVLAGNVGELDTAVRDLIGLDFGQFTRTVVLPQGDFARFLTDAPSNRQKLLRSLLELDIYARMGAAAREAAKVASNQAEALTSELERQEPVGDEHIEELAATVTALDELSVSVAAELQALAAIDQQLGPLRDRVVGVDEEQQALAAVAVPDDLARSAAALAEAEEATEGAIETVAEARAGRDEIQAAIGAIGDRSQLTETLARFKRLDEATADLTRTEEQLTPLRAELSELQVKVDQATVELDQAREAASAARRSADAAVWTARLVEGEPCPVCRQTVGRLPDHPHDDVAPIEAAVEAAQAELADLTSRQAKISGTVQAAEARMAELTSAVAEHRSALEGKDRERLAVQQDELRVLDQNLSDVIAALKEAEQNLQKLESGRKQLARLVDRASTDFARQRDAVSHLKPPSPERVSLLADWSALASWAVEHHGRLGAEREELAATGKDLARDRARLLERLTEAIEPFALDPDPAGLTAAVAAARAAAEGRVDAARERKADQERLRKRIDELSADREINGALGRHLSANGFEAWLLNEALDNIVAGATGWLLDLSGGAYSLVVSNRDFAVIDHNNADERRDVRTLSGGETFLTSLSLALALADSIAELAPVDAPRLESMFLDEGFGTLDAATLDVVAGAIEDLASSGRMIGIVTHVRDLAERMPARFEVTKTPTGSTVELVEA